MATITHQVEKQRVRPCKQNVTSCDRRTANGDWSSWGNMPDSPLALQEAQMLHLERSNAQKYNSFPTLLEIPLIDPSS